MIPLVQIEVQLAAISLSTEIIGQASQLRDKTLTRRGESSSRVACDSDQALRSAASDYR